METKVKDNGQAKVVNAVADKKAPQFVAGNPVNKESVKQSNAEARPQTEQGGFVNVNKLGESSGAVQQQKGLTNGTDLGVNVQIPVVKPVLNLEQTLLLINQLAEKTALRNTYNGYIDSLKAFVLSQNDDDMAKKDDTSFKGCELIIRDGKGHDFYTSSASVIAGTVIFMSGRFAERLAEVEAEIVIPA